MVSNNPDPPADAQTSVDAIYYRDAGSLVGARGISARARAAMYGLFVRELRPTAATTILDVGVSDEEGTETNMLEKQHPWPNKIVCAGLGDGRELRRSYPGVSYVKIDGSKGLPFHDRAFDVGWSNAVLEHVGGREQRAAFLRELIRVSRSIFVTVPNRWFPVEHHTGIPFLHWNAGVFRSLLRGTRLRHWTDPTSMDFLSREILLDEWPADTPVDVFYTGLRLGPFSSNLALVSKLPS
jgi:SAM-dependent methyltransferase